MEASPPKHEIRDEPAAAAAAGGGGRVLGALRQLIDVGVAVRRRLQAAAVFLFWGCLGCLGALRQLIEPEDRRLQAATFLLTFGGCTVLNGTVLNRSVNPEHVLAGFIMFTLGAAISILTLAGGGAGRAAAQMERFLRAFL